MINDKHINSVLNLSARERYKYFIKRSVDSESVYGLYSDGWVMVAGSTIEQDAIPFWPYKEFAEICATGIWDTCLPKPITLQDLINNFLPDLCKKGRLVAIFMTPDDKGIIVHPDELAAHLQHEESEWY